MTSDPNLSQVFDHWFKEMEADPAELPAFDADDQNGINTLMAFLDTVVDQSVESARSPTAPAPEQAPLLFFRTMETLAALIDSPPAAPDTSLSVLDELLDLPPHPSLVRPESAEKFSREHSPEYTNDAQPQASGNGVVKSRQFEQSMRVPIKQLDNLSNLVGELVVKRNRLEQDQERLRQFLDNLLNQVHNLNDLGSQMQDLYERTLLAAALQASRRKSYQPLLEKNDSVEHSLTTDSLPSQDLSLDALEMDRFTGFHLLSQAMIEGIVRIRESASDIQYLVDETDQVARSLRQVTTQLQAGMTQSRMVPFSQTADRLPRALRD
ncbi:MAG: Signal transduction histidine kinase CheA, partial [Cyanobacteriota bacterium]